MAINFDNKLRPTEAPTKKPKPRDWLSEESLNDLFTKFGGNDDKVIDFLRTKNLEVDDGDLQSIVEAFTMTHDIDVTTPVGAFIQNLNKGK